MIYIVMPRGRSYGWGLCGKHLVKEMAGLSSVKWVTEAFKNTDIGDEMEYRLLKQFLVQPHEARDIASGSLREIPCPVLAAISDHHMNPWLISLKGTSTYGYTFFERNTLTTECVNNAKQNFNVIITGSKYCETILRQHGLEHVHTIIQGVDPQIFNTAYAEKTYFRDHFVVFSGGKFELRKGQDIVIRAYKVLQDRHPDVMLVNAWHNHWPQSIATMQASGLISMARVSGDCADFVNQTLAANHIDLNRVITLSPLANAQLAKIYKNSDIGIFPNRCEGGTNLVLMEYMACGKPVIASYNSGHKDVVSSENAILIKKMKPMQINDPEKNFTWDDPDLDETVDKLEWAYQNQSDITCLGHAAGESLAECTWAHMGEQFYRFIMHN